MLPSVSGKTGWQEVELPPDLQLPYTHLYAVHGEDDPLEAMVFSINPNIHTINTRTSPEPLVIEETQALPQQEHNLDSNAVPNILLQFPTTQLQAQVNPDGGLPGLPAQVDYGYIQPEFREIATKRF